MKRASSNSNSNSNSRGLLLLTAMLLAVAQARAAPPGPRSLTASQAESLLRQPPRIDPAAARVLARVTAGYRKLKSLRSIARSGELRSLASLQRPRYYHLVQQTKEGELVALAVCDGRRHYEYTERTRRYFERDARILDRLALPPNVRPFFAGRLADPMVGLDGQPAVRDYAFTYSGRKKIGKKTADALTVSTLTRGRGGAWQAFEGTRWYDAASGLLLRTVAGARTTDYVNIPNPGLKTDDFRWRPIPGAVKGLG